MQLLPWIRLELSSLVPAPNIGYSLNNLSSCVSSESFSWWLGVLGHLLPIGSGLFILEFDNSFGCGIGGPPLVWWYCGSNKSAFRADWDNEEGWATIGLLWGFGPWQPFGPIGLEEFFFFSLDPLCLGTYAYNILISFLFQILVVNRWVVVFPSLIHFVFLGFPLDHVFGIPLYNLIKLSSI